VRLELRVVSHAGYAEHVSSVRVSAFTKALIRRSDESVPKHDEREGHGFA
jgi:hypothetical protein